MLYVVFTFGEMIIALSSYFEDSFSANNVYFSVMSFLIAVGIDCELKTVDSTILQATYTEPTGWDILLTQNACNVYAVTSFNPFSQDRYTTGTINHIHDDKLQELLNTAYALETASDETFMALHDYVIENAKKLYEAFGAHTNFALKIALSETVGD